MKKQGIGASEVEFKDLLPGMILSQEHIPTERGHWPSGVPGIIADKQLPDSLAMRGTQPRGTVWVFTPDAKFNAMVTVEINKPVKVLRSQKILDTVDDIPAGVMRILTTSYAGADPEIFAVDTHGTVIPSFEFMPSKKAPIISAGMGEAYYDGFQSEFTVVPGTCHGYLTDRVRHGLQMVWNAAKAKSKGATLTIDSAVPVSREMMAGVDPEHLALGCAPSCNAYGEERIAVPEAIETPWRYAGCHLHYGTSSVTPANVVDVVKFMDATAGVLNVAMGGKYNIPERRRYYGRAGEFRYHPSPTEIPYGHSAAELTYIPRLEYRVPDTILLAHPGTFQFFADMARMFLRMACGGYNFLWHADEGDVRIAINDNDVTLARKILERNIKMLRGVSERNYGANLDATHVLNAVCFEGIEAVLRDPRDVVENWMLAASSTTSDVQNDDVWGPEGYRGYRRPGLMWRTTIPAFGKGKKV